MVYKTETLEFVIKSGAIKKIKPIVDQKVDVVFPSTLGEKITTIEECCFSDAYFGKITLPNSVTTVAPMAFSMMSADEVVWSSGCNVIPFSCFSKSSIGKLSNIDHVSEVQSIAFESSEFKELIWPSACDHIPIKAFYGCQLSSIQNIDHVKSIAIAAFMCSSIESFVWPSSCSEIPSSCFQCCTSLKSIDNISHVNKIGASAFRKSGIEEFRWPDNCPVVPCSCFVRSRLSKIENLNKNVSEIENDAFIITDELKYIDLSNTSLCKISNHSFGNIKGKKIILPYYMDEEMVLNVGRV